MNEYERDRLSKGFAGTKALETSTAVLTYNFRESLLWYDGATHLSRERESTRNNAAAWICCSSTSLRSYQRSVHSLQTTRTAQGQETPRREPPGSKDGLIYMFAATAGGGGKVC